MFACCKTHAEILGNPAPSGDRGIRELTDCFNSLLAWLSGLLAGNQVNSSVQCSYGVLAHRASKLHCQPEQTGRLCASMLPLYCIVVDHLPLNRAG